MTTIVDAIFRVKRGTAADWVSLNLVLDIGEPGYEKDTQRIKYGDGVTAWNSLPYATIPLLGVAGGGTGATTAAGARTAFRSGCKLILGSALTGIDITAGYDIPWDTESFDDNAWHSTSTNTPRITVPSNVDRVLVGGSVRIANLTANTPSLIKITKNGNTIGGVTGMTSDTTLYMSFSVLDSCSAGDYYVANVTAADSSVNIAILGSTFWAEAH